MWGSNGDWVEDGAYCKELKWWVAGWNLTKMVFVGLGGMRATGGGAECNETGLEVPPPALPRTIMLVVLFIVFWAVGTIIDKVYARVRGMKAAYIGQRIHLEQMRKKLKDQIFQGMKGNVQAPVPGIRKCAQPLTIEFTELRMVMSNLTVLDGVSGCFEHSQLTAVMGPS
eukprot:gene28025-34662_t